MTIRIVELALAAGLIDARQLQEARAHQGASGGRLGSSVR